MRFPYTTIRSFVAVLPALLVLAALLAVAAPARASDNGGDDMVVFGGQHEIVREGQEVSGDLIVIGGSADVLGKVDGDAVALGGKIYISPKGHVNGNLVELGGTIDNESNQPQQPHERVTPPFMEETPTPAFPPSPIVAGYDWGWTWFYLVDALLTIVAFLLFPGLTRNASQSLMDNPVVAGVLGFFSPIIFVVVIIALTITLIGIPLIPLAIIFAIVGYLVGKAAIAEFLGSRIFLATKSKSNPLAAVLVGMAILFVLCAVTGWVGIVVYFCLGALAIGAALPLLRAIQPRRRPPDIAPPGPPPFSPPAEAHSGPPATQ